MATLFTEKCRLKENRTSGTFTTQSQHSVRDIDLTMLDVYYGTSNDLKSYSRPELYHFYEFRLWPARVTEMSGYILLYADIK
jgi:hypothetical protein